MADSEFGRRLEACWSSKKHSEYGGAYGHEHEAFMAGARAALELAAEDLRADAATGRAGGWLESMAVECSVPPALDEWANRLRTLSKSLSDEGGG